MSDSVEVKNGTAMKVLGWLLIFFSIVEFAIGGAVYGFLTNVHLGAWWGAICCFIAGICGAISNGRPAVVTGLVFSIFAIIISIVGAIVDGISAAIFAAEKGCINTETGDWWGSSDGKTTAYECATGSFPNYSYYNSHVVAAASAAVKASEGKDLQHYSYFYNNPYSNNNNFFYNHPNWRFYYNVNHYYNWYQTHNTYYWNQNHNYYNHNNNFYYSWGGQCVCSDNTVCFSYNLASGNDCGSILTTYSSLLSASTAFLCVLVLLSFIYSIFTCMSCGQSNYDAPPVAGAAPVQVVQMTPQTGAPVYVQPAGQQPVQYAPVPVVSGYVPQPQPVAYSAVVVGDGVQKEAI